MTKWCNFPILSACTDIADCRFPIAYCRLEDRLGWVAGTIGNWQSEFGNLLGVIYFFALFRVFNG